ncbi:hypothetical protein D3C80_1068180 [compost metagenome]
MHQLSETITAVGKCNPQACLCTGYYNIEETALFFQIFTGIETHRRREEIFFQAHSEGTREFQSFCRVNGHEFYHILVFVIFFIRIGKQSDVLQVSPQAFIFLQFSVCIWCLCIFFNRVEQFLYVLITLQALNRFICV